MTYLPTYVLLLPLPRRLVLLRSLFGSSVFQRLAMCFDLVLALVLVSMPAALFCSEPNRWALRWGLDMFYVGILERPGGPAWEEESGERRREMLKELERMKNTEGGGRAEAIGGR